MKTLLEIVTLSCQYLQERGIERARREAEDLIAYALKLKRIDLFLYHDRPLNPDELLICREFVKKRAAGIPAQYIAGEVCFAGCTLKVNPAVLIPRCETEILVEKVAQELAKEDLQGKVLWDMCTGSGCIAIALKKRFPELCVKASDLSAAALAVAQENAVLNGVEITFLQGDLFKPFGEETCDFFISNPPYVTEKEYETMPKQEPQLALVGGPSGLEFYQKIAQHLKAPRAWLEMGTGQGEHVRALFDKWEAKVEKDWANHDRFLVLSSLK